MSIKQISPEEAKEILDKEENVTYLDVRSELEFRQGHPEKAVNVPIMNFDLGSQMMVDNPDFMKVIENNFPKDRKYVVGCASGPRSQAVCEMMQQAGYKDVANVDGGFSGKRDMFGNVIKKGWAEQGFPVSTGGGDERSYETLKNKTKE
ncbi:rhodanese-like domain-containing protein [candidate division KSB1 bacterium]|nr:rhodanese-like domain-containing protein [candidate division KSB1 bacterium]NIR70947.1 rhodanese-like domain-containing protein [candidate division KSB1 bacterium]NIS23250.1 rhodanese-like domain-containing protein [candidate division KSB1 bacterium]NIT70132.1 rhodanese-like domain-containing protein [candidate division KSB1 bacterium]NIU23786.1 rhodanese-like domain-containing protein [candidate division KSB1 bacterium]